MMKNNKNRVKKVKNVEFKEILVEKSDYLERLKYLKDPARKLYFYGRIPEFSGKLGANPRFPAEKEGRPRTVAIVGARKMTAYGETWAFKFARELAEAGVIIVSGMALGIDTAAHKGALAGGGRTIAFLGTPIDKVYPAENKELFREILEKGGAVLSEYAPGEDLGPKLKTNSFLNRNRLISGISDAVIIVEADLRSGSLNTASHALEQGVPLFAIPGDLSRQMSRGCNQLFNKGASAITCVEDILNAVLPGSIRHQKAQKIELFGSTPDETEILRILAKGTTSGEEILEEIQKKESKFDISRFNIAITMLEIRGIVKREYGNQWILS
ncbi:DNA-processing protein DprA [Candidatus Saccharibacteria bacterium]|nr:DNA-processing protein DprA [Candidatus Saccharibacteria bacterium]